jgi:hypothetical protein
MISVPMFVGRDELVLWPNYVAHEFDEQFARVDFSLPQRFESRCTDVKSLSVRSAGDLQLVYLGELSARTKG